MTERPGSSRWLTFLHGAGQSPQVFGDQVTALPPGVRAAAPWLRGLRPGRDETFSLTDAAVDLARTSELQGAATTAVCGLGLGGRVGLEFALRHPGRVSALIMVSPLPQLPGWSKAAGTMMARLVPRSVYRAQNVDKAKVVAALRAAGSLTLPAKVTLDCPVLLVAGSRDAGGRAAVDQLRALLPSAHVSLIDGAGAQPNLENASAFNDLLYRFLDDPSRAGEASTDALG